MADHVCNNGCSGHGRWIVERDNDVPLAFDGELIAEVSSQEYADGPRWTEHRLYYAPAAGRYVVETVGMSSVEGEVPLRTVTVCDKHEIRGALIRKPKSYLTYLALDLIDAAIEKDPSLRDALVERL